MKQRDPKLTDVCARTIAPGIWVDGNDDVHVSIPDMLTAHGLPLTVENRGLMKELAETTLRQRFPGAVVFHRASPGSTPPLS